MTTYLTINFEIVFIGYSKILILETRLKSFFGDFSKVLWAKLRLQPLKLI